MAQIFPFSQATSIAFRSMATIAVSDNKLNIDMVSNVTGASRHHVAKVLQRLVQNGLISSKRGPGGGFCLNTTPQSISLLDIYESVEGKKMVNGFSKDRLREVSKEPFKKLSDDLSSHFISFLKTHTLSAYMEENSV